MFHDPNEQAPVPEQKNSKEKSDLGVEIFLGVVAIAIFCWLGYWILKTLNLKNILF